MFEAGCIELVVVGVVAILVLGGELPRAIRSVGRRYAKLRGEYEKLKAQIAHEIMTDETRDTVEEIKSAVNDIQHSIKNEIEGGINVKEQFKDKKPEKTVQPTSTIESQDKGDAGTNNSEKV